MTLVMDGVRRTGLITPPLVQPMRVKAPALSVAPAAAYRVGMDGIRRSVPTPREMLASMPIGAPEAAALELTPAIRDWQKMRRVATFSVLATTLTATGTATGLASLHTTAKAITPVVAQAAQIITPITSAAAASAAASAPAAAPIDTGLQALLNSFTGGSSMYGVVVTNLSTGETAGVNASAPMEVASLYKLFVASEIYRRLDVGQLSLGQAAGSSGRTVGDCLTAMITVSDNTCGQALGSIVGWGDHNAALLADGYQATNLAGAYPSSTAADIAKLYGRLYDNTLNSPAANDAYLSLLKDQRINSQLPSGLPAGTVIAHKTGALDGYVHDAGIVYGPKANYVVVVLSGPWGSPGTANSQFQSLSSQLWNHFEQ